MIMLLMYEQSKVSGVFKEDFSILNYGEDYLEQMFEFIEKNTELDTAKHND